jgi:hypothetical protein
MRCDECGRPIKNAELWQLAGDPHAPTSRSMQQLCWDCRQKAEKPSERADATSILDEASEVASRYDADHV